MQEEEKVKKLKQKTKRSECLGAEKILLFFLIDSDSLFSFTTTLNFYPFFWFIMISEKERSYTQTRALATATETAIATHKLNETNHINIINNIEKKSFFYFKN